MKPSFGLVIACFAFCAAEEQKNPTKPQALVDLKNLRNGLHTKAENVGRFFKHLTSGTSELPIEKEKPRDKSTLRVPFISRSYRRLNIFGLQPQPDKPEKDSAGNPKQSVPEILDVTRKSESLKIEPNFSVVWPQSDQNSLEQFSKTSLTNHHYPTLDLDELFQQPPGSVQQQPKSYYFQTIPESYHREQFCDD